MVASLRLCRRLLDRLRLAARDSACHSLGDCLSRWLRNEA